MSTLEDLVRRSLALHEQEAPSGYDLADRVRRGRRRRTQRGLAAVAAVSAVGVVAAVSLVSGGSDAARPGPVATLPPPPPAGTIALGYRGVEMDVPDDFQRAGCLGEHANTYDVGDGAHFTSLCEAIHPVPLQAAVNIHAAPTLPAPADSDASYATERTTVDGEPAHKGTAPATSYRPEMSVLVLDEQHLLLTVASSDAETRDRLMATVHLIGPFDRHGCPVHDADLDPPATTRTGSDLVPEDPDAITVCAYTDGWIRDSRVRSGADLRSLVDALNALPPGASHDPLNSGPRCREPREGLVLHLTYPDRVLDEVARIHTCGDFFIGDQHGRSQVTFDITRELIDGLVYDGTFPSPGVLQPE